MPGETSLCFFGRGKTRCNLIFFISLGENKHEKVKQIRLHAVELVIVIAVIAILAGVMIAVFSNVVNDAKESAKEQELKQAELQQKSEDIIKKLENADWLSRENIEVAIAEGLEGVNAGATEPQITAAKKRKTIYD